MIVSIFKSRSNMLQTIAQNNFSAPITELYLGNLFKCLSGKGTCGALSSTKILGAVFR